MPCLLTLCNQFQSADTHTNLQDLLRTVSTAHITQAQVIFFKDCPREQHTKPAASAQKHHKTLTPTDSLLWENTPTQTSVEKRQKLTQSKVLE